MTKRDRKEQIKEQAIEKASQSSCNIRVAAIGLDKRGRIVARCHNKPFLFSDGGSLHAEELMMRRHPHVKTIIICRIGKDAAVRPIHPCDACQRMADNRGIEIRTIEA